MKRYTAYITMFLLIGTVLAGCSGQSSDDQQGAEETVAEEAQAEEMAGDSAADEEISSSLEDQEADSISEDMDEDGDSSVVDLTSLGSIMVYSEVYNIMMHPEDYLNKTIKINGSYFTQYSSETQQNYYFVLNEDAEACCQQGLEFIWNGEHTYPDDYPAEGDQIEVSGVFQSYEELGKTYYYIAVDEMIM